SNRPMSSMGVSSLPAIVLDEASTARRRLQRGHALTVGRIRQETRCEVAVGVNRDVQERVALAVRPRSRGDDPLGEGDRYLLRPADADGGGRVWLACRPTVTT